MTALNTLTAPVRWEGGAQLLPVPWRRMAWVTWRQHRSALIGLAVLLGALAVYMWIVGLQLHTAAAAAAACHPASADACFALVNTFNGKDTLLAAGYPLQVLPALIGAFVGAPVLAREFETGTFRYAWTQGFGRWRWTVAKLVGLGVVVTAAAGALSLLFSWYYQPYFALGNRTIGTTEFVLSPFSTGLFDLRGVVFAAWTLAAFALGVMAGTLIRRVVPAIVATLAAYTALAIATGAFLRQHYLTPLVTTRLNVPGSAWVLSQQWTTRSGHPVSASALGQVLTGTKFSAGAGGVPQSLLAYQDLARHGYQQVTTYQPASRFWSFQWIEGGWLLALSIVLIGATVWLVRRRGV
jgi:hypothetical protein